MEMKLAPRLKKIADLVLKNSRVADIGTDHGYIPIYLLQNQITSHIIASDVNEGPLRIAKKNIISYGFTKEIEIRLGSGLQVLKVGEVDTVIIAGMGGMLIAELLEADIRITKSIETFILQPMQAQKELRKYLLSSGFKIYQDILVKEDFRIYEIIVAKKGSQTVMDDIYYEIGLFLKSNPKDIAIEFISGKIKNEEEIIGYVKHQDSINALERYRKSKKKLEMLREVLQWLQE